MYQVRRLQAIFGQYELIVLDLIIAGSKKDKFMLSAALCISYFLWTINTITLQSKEAGGNIKQFHSMRNIRFL